MPQEEKSKSEGTCAYGHATIEPDTGIVGRCESFEITYVVGETPIQANGSLLFFIPKCGFSSPKLYPDEEAIASYRGTPGGADNSLTGMVWVSVSNPDVEYDVSIEHPDIDFRIRDSQGKLLRVHPGFPGYPVQVLLRQGTLTTGDQVVLLYGDTHSGSPGAACGTYAHTAEFPVWVDPSGDRSGPLLGYGEVTPAPGVAVTNESPVKLNAIVPSVLAPEEPFSIRVVARDKYENACRDYAGELALDGQAVSNLPGRHRFTEEDKGVSRINGVRVSGSERAQVAVRDLGRRIQGKSNPIQVAENGDPLRLYWGDLHTHTADCDGLGTVAEALEYARDVAGMDFGATSCHDRMLTPERWEKICQTTQALNEEGRFVTLAGYEYTASQTGGHKNVYYYDGEGPLHRHIDPGLDDPRALLSKLKRGKALAIPHHTPHPTMTTDWRFHDPEVQRLVEIYSEWGSSEYIGTPRPICRHHQREKCPSVKGSTVQDALARGHRLGFVGGSDNHSGQLGYCDLMGRFGRRRAYRGGITAVFAKALTRDALWQALYARRCYATTGVRMIIRFRVGDHVMGEGIELPDPSELRQRAVSVQVLGTNTIESVSLLRNNEIIHSVRGSSDKAAFEYADRDALNDIPAITDRESRTVFYYVRVIQEDGEMGWASPIWFHWRKAG